MAKLPVTGETKAPAPKPSPAPKATPTPVLKPTPFATPMTISGQTSTTAAAAAKEVAAAKTAATAKAAADAKAAAAAKTAAANKTAADKTPAAKTTADKAAADKAAAKEKRLFDLEDEIQRLKDEAAAQGNGEDPGVAYAKAQAEKDREDAFENLKVVFASYGMSSLSDTITRLMRSGETANSALVKLKYDKTIDPATGKAFNAAYTTRFSGNEKRISSGLNALSEAEYINLEDSYAATLKSYGLGTMLTTSRETNETMLAKYIGADISATEFKDRIQTVEDRVVNADASIKDTFKAWYPNISDSDLVQYFLDPTTTIGKLKEKATAAEIGGTAKGQGLAVLQGSSEALAAYGVDRATALQGYQNIGEVLPASSKLSEIYGEAGIAYNQAVGEEEFFKGNAKAAEQRKQLKSLERASFSGSGGIDRGSLSRNTQGSF